MERGNAGKRSESRFFGNVLGALAGILVLYHFFISVARHFYSTGNVSFKFPIVKTWMEIDEWMGIAIAALVLLYTLCRWISRRSAAIIRKDLRRYFSRELVILAVVFLWYIVATAVAGAEANKKLLQKNWFHISDMAICTFVIFPFVPVLGSKRARPLVDMIFHVMTVFTTGFIVWALWNVLHLNEAYMPDGEALCFTQFGAFFPGVHQNIAGAIGTTVILMCVYMMAMHRGIIRVLYGIAIWPHLIAVILTTSRGNFLALLVALPLMAFMAAWTRGAQQLERDEEREKKTKRLVIAVAVALITVVAFWFFRPAVIHVAKSVVNREAGSGEVQSQIVGMSNARYSLTYDTGRLTVWPSAVKAMTGSSHSFFFGHGLDGAPAAMEEAMAQLFENSFAPPHAHNQILQVGVVQGVPSMILYVAFLIMLAVRCVQMLIRNRADNAWIVPICILALVIVNMFEQFLTYYFSVVACQFALFAGWAAGGQEEQK